MMSEAPSTFYELDFRLLAHMLHVKCASFVLGVIVEVDRAHSMLAIMPLNDPEAILQHENLVKLARSAASYAHRLLLRVVESETYIATRGLFIDCYEALCALFCLCVASRAYTRTALAMPSLRSTQ